MGSSPYQFLSPPVGLRPDATAAWVITIAGLALIALALVLMLVETRRTKAVLPVVVFLSAMTWLPLEAFVDVPMGVWHSAHNPLIAMHVLGRPLPLYVASVGAAFFLGGWGVYRVLQHGMALRPLVILLIAMGVLDYVLEMPSAHFHVVQYYGDNPSRIFGLPLYAMVQNMGVYVVQGWLILALAPYLTGVRALLALPLMPSAYIAYAFGCTWPAYVAVQSSASPVVTWGAIALSTAMNAAVPYALLRTPLVERHRRAAARATPTAAPAVPDRAPAVA